MAGLALVASGCSGNESKPAAAAATKLASCQQSWKAGWQRLANRLHETVYCPTWMPSPIDAKIGAHRQTAALYDVFPAADRPLKPAGEWNTSEVIVRGKHVEHWLNGKKVLQYELDSPEIRAAIAKSKFKDIDRFGKPQNGHILIQDHGDRVWIKDMKIKRLK